MCGIAGLFDLTGTREIERRPLERMSAALEHRGPDGAGLHVEPGLGLVHRRLAVIDPGAGAQPFTAQGGHAVLTFNGEVYNHASLRPTVERAGRTLRTRCDTEVLAELLALRGEDALHDLRGMFAFAAWLPREGALILARDRFGEKPLYYAVTKDGLLVFASEMPALLASGLVANLIEERAVADYLFYGYVPDPHTIYRGVSRLPAGHVLTLRRGAGTAPAPRRWYAARQSEQHGLTPEEAGRATAGLLAEAVAEQRVADVPLGAFLSGGIDSAAVASVMADHGPAPVTCTVGFEDAASDERAAAAALAARLGTRHHEAVATVDVEALVPAVAASYGEPFADAAALPAYLVCRLAREHVTVALSGDGADEVFGGYARYEAFAAARAAARLVRGPARGITRALGRAYPKLDWAPRPVRLRSTLAALGETPARAYASAVSAVLPDVCRAVLAAPLRDADPARHVEAAWGAADTDDPVILAQAADMATWLPGRMLVKMDRASMAHSLEVRAPYLDHRLAEAAAAFPRAARVFRGQRKIALREAMRDRLPPETLARPKRGFDAPVDLWFRQEGGALTKRLLAQRAWADSGYFDVDAVRARAKAHVRGRERHGQLLWSVLMFGAFLETA